MPKNDKYTACDTARMIWQLGNTLVTNRNRKLFALDLTSVQTEVMVFLLKNMDKEEINQLDIQEYLMLTNPAVTGILKRVEEKGFIVRTKSTKDARNKNIKLTQKGLDLMNILIENMAEEEARIIQGMSGKEQEEFKRLLNIAIQNIKE